MRRSEFLIGSSLAAGGITVASPALAQPTRPVVTLGNETFLAQTWRELHGRGVGVVTNQTGVTSTLVTIVDAIRENPAISLRAIFAPEHGLRGDRPAAAYVPSYVDERTGLPVYSLYGATRHPSAEMLEGIDVLLFDIQDVGDRAYTYISTLAYVMTAAARYGKSVWVLDRPNPIGGSILEGPVLDPHFASFIGLYQLPIRHGCTIGELARIYNDRFGIGCRLEVVPMTGYTREMFWPETGLSWVKTSPNIPSWSTTLVYPATGLVGSAGVNNGTGDTRPFKPFFFAGGYRVDGARLADALDARALPGVRFRAASWTPMAGFWAGKSLTGVELQVTDRRAFRAVRTSVEVLVAVRSIAPSLLQLGNAAIIDRDWGTDSLRKGLEAGLDADAILQPWEAATQAFNDMRQSYLLYLT
jgi:uncharacterized protein YbbC (DUF1343 family)